MLDETGGVFEGCREFIAVLEMLERFSGTSTPSPDLRHVSHVCNYVLLPLLPHMTPRKTTKRVTYPYVRVA